MIDIEYMELSQLKDRENYLQRELYEVRDQIENYELNELEKTYGKDFCCEKCRYNAVLDFSGDGWHNLCGNYIHADCCTCCNHNCAAYKPDTRYTKWIKHCVGQISKDYQHAIDIVFKVNLFGDDGSISEEKWDEIKTAFVLADKIKDKIEKSDF
jgi:hypothetical protein